MENKSSFLGDINKLNGPWNNLQNRENVLIYMFDSQGQLLACNVNYAISIGHSFEDLSDIPYRITQHELCSNGEIQALLVLKQLCTNFTTKALQSLEFTTSWMSMGSIVCMKQTWYFSEDQIWSISLPQETFMDHILVNNTLPFKKDIVKGGLSTSFTDNDFYMEDVYFRSSLDNIVQFLAQVPSVSSS